MILCQIAIIFELLVVLLVKIKFVIDGRPSLRPTGYWGVVGVIINCGIAFWVFKGAGAFSMLGFVR